MEIRFLCGNGRKGPGSLQKKCFGEKIICFSNKKCLKPSLGFTHGYKVGTSIRSTWTWSWIWSWRSMRTVKKSWIQTRTMRLIIFSQPSVFIRGHLHAQLEPILNQVRFLGKPWGQSARARDKRSLIEAYKHALFWDGMSVTREKQWS